ncbi:LysM peptidoglycan-binding domain-containing protein [Sporofaciens musculi]|jgi:LysM repeat protein|uniref:LysM peptidoglycan-binding domain-containing protein n=1 Tax=Sporofaciens musculi TaxID=2681861 RepID=UPI00259CE46D|nr:LysM peptidoglycan-binding domain-containing protein [Sporofaciens musculi]
MERQFPKNVRQIGNVGDEPKIYVEDYVDIYLNQLQQQAEETPVGVILIGEILKLEGQDVVCISGAMGIRDVRMNGTEIVIEKETFKGLDEERKKYFPSSESVGWCLIENGHPSRQDREIKRIHHRNFARDNTVFIWKDALDQEETFYSYRNGDLVQMDGHYIYYEKNPDMQNYMIMTRKQNGVIPCEVVEDRAAKDFRSTVRARIEEKERQSSRLIYATSALLVVVVLAIGISTVNNFDKMEAVQDSLESLSQSVNQPESTTKTVSEDQAAVPAGQPIEETNTGEPESVEKAEKTAETGGTVPDPSTIQEQLGNENYYVVQKGDTLDSISVKLYGDTSHVKAICKMNGLSDGNLIYIGQKLLLP